MKSKLTFVQCAALLVLLSSLNYQLSTYAQGTTFTYQGRLNSGPALADGLFDFTFTLHDHPTNSATLTTYVLLSAVPVANGLFTVRINTNSEFGHHEPLDQNLPRTGRHLRVDAQRVRPNLFD